MKKIVTLSVLLASITSCDYIGSTRVKNLIDLTTKLENQASTESVNLGSVSNVDVYSSRSYSRVTQGNIIGQPEIVNNIAYSIDEKGYASAYALDKRKLLWREDVSKSIEKNFSSGGILHYRGNIYIANGSRDLIILDAKNGNEIIRKTFPDIIRSKPAIIGDLIIAQTISNQVIAYNINSSEFEWIHEGNQESIASRADAHPIVHKSNILVSYSSGEVVYLNKNGQELWRYYLADVNASVSSPGFDSEIVLTTPIIEGDNVYFATSRNKILKINLNNGTTIWSKDAEDIQSMQILGNSLFVTNNARQIAALSLGNGSVKWAGDLISESYRKARKPKPTLFQAPFLSKSKNGGNAVNVVAANGELYHFPMSAGKLPNKPIILSIKEEVSYFWTDQAGRLYFVIRNFFRF